MVYTEQPRIAATTSNPAAWTDYRQVLMMSHELKINRRVKIMDAIVQLYYNSCSLRPPIGFHDIPPGASRGKFDDYVLKCRHHMFERGSSIIYSIPVTVLDCNLVDDQLLRLKGIVHIFCRTSWWCIQLFAGSRDLL